MSLKKLSTQDMLKRSAYWLGEGRQAMLEHEALHGAIELLERAHKSLEHALEADQAIAGELRRLSLELNELDLLHDRRVRGIFHILTGLGEALDDEDLAGKLHALRQELLPRGINTTLLTYAEQAEEAARASALLTDEKRALLSRISLPGDGGTLLEQVESWLETGESLANAWEDHHSARGEAGEQPAEELSGARNRWVGAVRVLVTALDATELDHEARRELLAIE